MSRTTAGMPVPNFFRTVLSLMLSLFKPLWRYLSWLHVDGIPAGTVEKLPDTREGGKTNIPGVRVVGDLTGIPLLKFSSDSGARAVMEICGEADFESEKGRKEGVLDLAIVGGGVSGIAAAIEAKKCGLSFEVFEAARPFSTIADFPKGKPIYAYPEQMKPAGDLQFTAGVKEDLVEELERHRRSHGIETTAAHIERVERKGGELLLHHAGGKTTRALRVIVAIGRSGNFRKLGVPGEERDKVYNRLHDPTVFAGKHVLVIGGGDSALEAAIALTTAGAHVVLSYRRAAFNRPKPDNVEMLRTLAEDPAADLGVAQPTSERETTAFTSAFRKNGPTGTLTIRLGTQVRNIDEKAVVLVDGDGNEETLANDVVFSMIGREPPLDFFRRSGIAIRREWTKKTWAGLLAFIAFCAALYNWKSWGFLTEYSLRHGWFPFSVKSRLVGLGGWIAGQAADPSTLVGTLAASATDPGFYYTTAYCTLVVVFGIRRMRRRRTPYVKRQTLSLMAFQLIPLSLLPYVILPWLGANGAFQSGVGAWIGSTFFPGGSYWRAFGFILAWPLFVYNVFTAQPLWGWLAVSLVQTFVIIPLIVLRWGKGAYCGWICSCGALAETLGDQFRYKMPHGEKSNRLNMAGQVILWVAFLLLLMRVIGWLLPGSWPDLAFAAALKGVGVGYPWSLLNWKWVVDVFLAGIIGYGLYFWFSGRVWCRFFCPLAALMHIYARFSSFRIFADKKKCISCNVCTAACHQGIDIMNFANKGLPMNDPECVRCSACVQECPTGVLTFGRLTKGPDGEKALPVLDPIAASPVQMREGERDTNKAVA